MEPALHLPPEGLPAGYMRDLCQRIRKHGLLELSFTVTPESDLSQIKEIDPYISTYQLWGFDYHRPKKIDPHLSIRFLLMSRALASSEA